MGAPLIPWWNTDFGQPEIDRVTAAIWSKKISQGTITREFEERLAEVLGVPYVVCTTSGTTALTMALMAAGIGQFNSVIVPDRTWIATAHAVMMAGARVVLHDVDENGMLPGVQRQSQKVLPVNLNGRLAVCGASDIEDSCQAFPAPPRGLIACYSLSTAKIIATGQGGFCATRDEAIYRELKALRTHDVADAMVPQVLKWTRFGYNFRFTDIQAAIGLAQLDRLAERKERLHEIHAVYRKGGISVQPSPLPLYNEYLCDEPELMREHLAIHGIEARPFYPPLHSAPYLMPAHREAYHDYEFPNAMKWGRGLFLPSGPAQSLADIERVVDALHCYGY